MSKDDNITPETLITWLAQPHDISTRTMAEATYWAHQFKLAVEWAQKIQKESSPNKEQDNVR